MTNEISPFAVGPSNHGSGYGIDLNRIQRAWFNRSALILCMAWTGLAVEAATGLLKGTKISWAKQPVTSVKAAREFSRFEEGLPLGRRRIRKRPAAEGDTSKT